MTSTTTPGTAPRDVSRINMDGLMQGMDAAGLDVLVAAWSDNFTYIIGTLLLSDWIIPDRLCMPWPSACGTHRLAVTYLPRPVGTGPLKGRCHAISEAVRASQQCHSKRGGVMAHWFYKTPKGVYGPVSAKELIGLRRAGKLRETNHVRKGSTGRWVKATRVKGLFHTSEQVPLAPPIISDAVPVSQPVPSTIKRSQFSIWKIMLWTAIVAGGVAIGKLHLFLVPLYGVPAFGLLSVLRYPKSWAVWFPTAMNLFCFHVIGLAFLCLYATQGDGSLRWDFMSTPCLIVSWPYGGVLLVSNVRHSWNHGFSFPIFLYHLSSCLAWILLWYSSYNLM